jgi:hypothetical protein
MSAASPASPIGAACATPTIDSICWDMATLISKLKMRIRAICILIEIDVEKYSSATVVECYI